MQPFFIIEDEESEYKGQIATLIYKESKNGLTIFYCRMDNGDRANFLSCQIGESFFLRSEAEQWKNK